MKYQKKNKDNEGLEKEPWKEMLVIYNDTAGPTSACASQDVTYEFLENGETIRTIL